MCLADNKIISINKMIINELQDSVKICTSVYTDASKNSHYHQIKLQSLQISS